MTLEKFVDTYLGKAVDFDDAFGAQCVDLFRQYCKDVWDTPHLGAVCGAQDLWKHFDAMPLMGKYLGRKMGNPNSGDIVVFSGTPSNPYGHVALVLFASATHLVVLEQDGTDEKTVTHVGVWDTSRVLGYLCKIYKV